MSNSDAPPEYAPVQAHAEAIRTITGRFTEPQGSAVLTGARVHPALYDGIEGASMQSLHDLILETPVFRESLQPDLWSETLLSAEGGRPHPLPQVVTSEAAAEVPVPPSYATLSTVQGLPYHDGGCNDR